MSQRELNDAMERLATTHLIPKRTRRSSRISSPLQAWHLFISPDVIRFVFNSPRFAAYRTEAKIIAGVQLALVGGVRWKIIESDLQYTKEKERKRKQFVTDPALGKTRGQNMKLKDMSTFWIPYGYHIQIPIIKTFHAKLNSYYAGILRNRNS